MTDSAISALERKAMLMTRSPWAEFLHGEGGQDLIEYALLAATIALGMTLAMTGVRDAVRSGFLRIETTLGS